MIEKIIEKLEELPVVKEILTSEKHPFTASEVEMVSKKAVLEIVQEVAKEYDWIPVEEKLPEDFTYVYATCISLIDNRKPWVVESEYNSATGWRGLAPMVDLGKAEVTAWMPRKLPAPYQKGEQKKAYDEEKCRIARNFAACADSYCSDDCNMQCPHEKGVKSMGRLTWKKPDGTWGLVNGDIQKVPKEYYGYMCKLRNYEETGLDPERIEEVNELYLEKCKEVNELQAKAEEYQSKIENLLEQLSAVSFESQGIDVGMGGQMVVAMDDVVEIVRGETR